jgi:hypothetical protein
MERKNRLKNVAPDDKAAKALLNGRLMDGAYRRQSFPCSDDGFPNRRFCELQATDLGSS